MKTQNTTINISAIANSRHNVNSNDVSAFQLATDIANSGWLEGSRLTIAGERVSGHKKGECLQGNNRLHAIKFYLVKKAKLTTEDLKAIGIDLENIPVTVITDANELEVAELYNDRGNDKTVDYPQLVKIARKYFQAGLVEADIAVKCRGIMQAVKPLVGDKLEKVQLAEKNVKANKITQKEFKKTLGDVRRGYTQAIKAWCSSDYLMSVLDFKYYGLNPNNLPESVKSFTNSDAKAIEKATAKDFNVIDGGGVKVHSAKELQAGETPKVLEAINTAIAKIDKPKTDSKLAPMLKRSDIAQLKERAQSKTMQAILHIILGGESNHTLVTLDKELQDMEAGTVAKVKVKTTASQKLAEAK